MVSPPTDPSLLLKIGFVFLAVSLVSLFAFVLKSPRFFLIGLLWLILTGVLSVSGFLSDFSTSPPRILFVLFPAIVITIILGMSKLGQRMTNLPLQFLVGYQAFRIPVEFLIHQASIEGIAPPQMSWDGINFDIISGLTALFLLPFVKKVPVKIVLIWNALSLGLLIWVVGVAILSFPSPFQKLEPDNTWVAFFPFIWLPTIAVTFALLGHIVLFRKLLISNTEQVSSGNQIRA